MRDILERRIEDAPQSLCAVEADMRGEDDVVAAQEIMMLPDLPDLGRPAILMQALLLFLDLFLSLEDIETGAGEGMVIERPGKRRVFYDAAAGGVDEQAAQLHLLDALSVDEMMRALIVGHVQGHDVGFSQYLIERRISEVQYLGKECIVAHIVRDDMHAEALGDADDVQPDMPGADDAERLVLEIESDEPLDREILFQSACVGLVDIAGKGENKRECVLGDRIFPVVGDVQDHDTLCLAGSDVDMIEAGRTGRDAACLLQLSDDCRGECRIDEDGNNFVRSGLGRIFFCQRFREEKKLVTVERAREIFLVRSAGFEKSDFHGRDVQINDFSDGACRSRPRTTELAPPCHTRYYTPKTAILTSAGRHVYAMETTEKKITLEIPRRFVDKRFDVAALALIQEKYGEIQLSRGALARLIKAGEITLNGAQTRANHQVDLHDMVAFFEKSLLAAPLELESRQDIRIPLLYEDDLLIAIDKPAGIQTHPAGNMERETVAHFIAAKYPALSLIGGNPLRPGIVHRLDRETSGVLVIAKTQPAFEELKKLFQTRVIEKTYVALAYGHMPALEGAIDKPLMQRSGELKRVVVETQSAPVAAREALTLYRVMARYQDFDLLLVTPKTGRTHQIRAHLASLGNPIVGDKLYAFKPMQRGEKLFSARQMLHAYRLKFELFSKKYAFEAPLPEDFCSLLQSIDETREAGYDDEALKSLFSE